MPENTCLGQIPVDLGDDLVMSSGALCAETGEHIGRSPKDKHTVVDAQTEHTMGWDGNRKITPAQFHFLSGYTAKVAGTEKGLTGVEPEFSTCFGAPFLPRPPQEYGKLLGQYIERHKVDCWLVNSGWTGGIYGVGRRMPIKVTRALVTGALDGSLKNVSFRTDPYFGFAVPTAVPGIDTKILNPDQTWADKKAFDETARKLVGMFQKNFAKYEQTVDAEVRAAAPEIRLAAE